MPTLLADHEHWMARAKEAREMAATIVDAEARRTMLEITASYEKIAQRAEAREVGIGMHSHQE
jgi:hypothetical protein